MCQHIIYLGHVFWRLRDWASYFLYIHVMPDSIFQSKTIVKVGRGAICANL